MEIQLTCNKPNKIYNLLAKKKAEDFVKALRS